MTQFVFALEGRKNPGVMCRTRIHRQTEPLGNARACRNVYHHQACSG
jgi:hypothetical protein